MLALAGIGIGGRPAVARPSRRHYGGLVVISVVVFAALGTPDLWLRVVSRIGLIPAIAALAYEVIRLGGALHDHPWVRFLMRPNLALQALTTRQPDDAQVEVALHALKAAMALEGRPFKETPSY